MVGIQLSRGTNHDDVPRERSDGQPNYIKPSYEAQHCMMLVNGDICPTEFALGDSEFEDVPMGQVYYKVWHPQILQKIKDWELAAWKAPSNQLIYFDWQTWHQGTRAIADGWRFFIRASWNTGRKPLNEVRRQVQVYLEFLMEGW